MSDTLVDNHITGVLRIDPDTGQPTYIKFGDVCKVGSDGSIEINPRYEPHDAAVAFWRAVREVAPNMVSDLAIAIGRMEALTSVGWYIGRGRETSSEPLYAAAIVAADSSGLTRGKGFEVVAEGDTLTDAIERAVTGYESSTAVRLEKRPNYLVWSNEHMAWWGPGQRGYFTSIARAGLYTRDAALQIVEAATLAHNWVGHEPPNEVCVCVDDLPLQARRELGA